MRLDIKQTHVQKLSARVEQSVRILQMGSQELEEYIFDAMLENPVIEVEYSDNNSSSAFDFFPKKRNSSFTSLSTDEINRLIENIASPYDTSLSSHLMAQIRYSLSGDTASLVAYLVGFINDNGYLEPDFDTICSLGVYSKSNLSEALSILQSFDPPGVGASTLAECLCLQLDADDSLSRLIIENHMRDIASNNISHIARSLKVSKAEVISAVKRIKELSPKPGAHFAANRDIDYIHPDIVVYKDTDNHFEASLIGASIPTLYPNAEYLKMAQTIDDAEIKLYLKSKIEQYNWISRCIEKRNSTLLDLSKTIIHHQERFFKYGPLFLNSFRMSDAADILGMHESTISRAVNGKWLLCEHGVFPLKYFFVRSLQDNLPNVSVLDAKHEISSIISSEDPKKPFSDQYIADYLSNHGVPISRRTVAKYRTQMSIQPAHLRAHRV